MSEFSNNTPHGHFDRTIDDAWGAYRTALADRIAAASIDDQLTIEAVCESDAADGRVPFVQCHVVAGPEGTVVRCEIPADPHLPPRRRLTATDLAALHALGWTRPAPSDPVEPALFEGYDGPALVVEKPSRWADQLAAMTVSVFRDTWGVPHPSFLALQHLGVDGDVEPSGPGPDVPPPQPFDRHAAIRTRDIDHLREVIARTVRDIFGREPEFDGDGDIVLRFGSALALVIANESIPEVQLWAPLVRDISGRTRAAELITDLNRRWPYLRFALFEDRLRVMIDLLADPFVPQHLADMIEHLGEFLNNVDQEFAAHFGGRLHFPPPTAAADTVGAPPATPPVEALDSERDTSPEPEQPNPVQEPIQPSLFDDLDDQ